MHDALVVFHRWLGLIASIFILIIATTGSALVFEGAIDRAQHPELWQAPGTGTMSYDTLAARASQAAKGAAVSTMAPPLEVGRPAIASVGAQQVFINPHTGAILGTRELAAFNHSLPRRLHRLHVELLVKDGGSTIVALMTIAALLLTVTGIVIWWKDKRWRMQWRASWKRIVFDLHHTLGIAASLVLFLISASGVVIHYNALGSAIASVGGGAQRVPPKQPTSSGSATAVGFDSALHAATRALPGAQAVFIGIPEKGDQPIRVAMRFPEDRTPGGRSRVYLDRFSGSVLGTESTREAKGGMQLSNNMRSLHTGDIYGAITRAIWFAAALALAVQSLSGFVMWWNQRPARVAAARRRAVTAT